MAAPIAGGGNASGSYQSASGKTTLVLCLVFAVFFLLAGVTNINDALVKKFQNMFQLSNFEAALVQFAFFTSYALFSIPAGILLRKIGFIRGFVTGFLIIAAAALLFIPAASSGQYINFLGALFLIGGGITLLQVAMNPLVTTLGPPETSHSRLTFAQMFNSLGAYLIVTFGAFYILGKPSDVDATTLSPDALAAFRLQEAEVITHVYTGVAIFLIAMAALFWFFRSALDDAQADDVEVEGTWTLFMNDTRLRFGALCIFLYVGAEVTIGSFIVKYVGLDRVLGASDEQAVWYLSSYWGGALIGRFVGAGLLRFFNPGYVLTIFGSIAITLIAISAFSGGSLSALTLTAVGLFNSIMFPTIFSLATEGMRAQKAAQGSGILATAIVGGAIIPLIYGAAADGIGLTAGLIVPVICYAIIAGYGVYARGRRPVA
ncbi:MAG: sugar MFS transporter [Sphingomonadales bacterium]|nr:sugar MFS transporter [Sphingomonadales bacterium]